MQRCIWARPFIRCIMGCLIHETGRKNESFSRYAHQERCALNKCSHLKEISLFAQAYSISKKVDAKK